MHWRRFRVSDLPLETLEAFDEWLQGQWREKDKLLEEHAKTGRFPSPQGEYVSTEVQLSHWWELWRFTGLQVAFMIAFAAASLGLIKVM